jgi:hypothetical protein
MNYARTRFVTLILVLALTGGVTAQSHSAHFQTPTEAGLESINAPGGGGIFYGELTKDTTMQTGMITMLRALHAQFGERPQVGQFFHTQGSDSMATFFTLNAHSKGGGEKKISGMVIVSLQPGSAPAGAALFDDAAHFSQSEPRLMNTLNDAWRNSAAKNAPAAPSTPEHASGATQPLHMATGGDRSATVGLPDGWQLTSVRGGQLTATGPHDEMMGLGLIIGQIHDPRGGGSARTYNGQQAIVAQCGGDIFSSYTSVMNQARQRNNLPAGTWTRISSTPLNAQTIETSFEVDFHDGKGLRQGSAQVGEMMCGGRSPGWAMTIAQAFAPVAVWQKERTTITAIYKSYSQDESVIRGETQRTIDNIHAIGARSKQQAADTDARRVASSQSFNQHMDDIDRQSKAFQNYTLDQQQLQVIGDDGNAYRGTVDNNAANALIQADPNRFQSVPTGSFIKGVDY